MRGRNVEIVMYGSVGEAIAERRRALGLTQGQLAERIGSDQRTISRIEHTRSPHYAPEAPLLNALARELGFTVEELLAVAGYAVAEAGADPEAASITEHFDRIRAQVLAMPGLAELERRMILTNIDGAEQLAKERVLNG